MKRLTLAVLATIAALLPGCSEDSLEEGGHVHHEIPEHRPANLKDAVAAIEQRSSELANNGGRLGSLEYFHFVDIISWVPELAADSDLKKADWETANAAAGRMRARVLSKQLDITRMESVVENDLSILRALVPEAGRPEPSLHHHHHHDHEHPHGPGEHAHHHRDDPEPEPDDTPNGPKPRSHTD